MYQVGHCLRKLSCFIILCNLSSILPNTSPRRYMGSAGLAPRILNIKVTWTNCLLKTSIALRLEQQPSACRHSVPHRQSADCRHTRSAPHRQSADCRHSAPHRQSADCKKKKKPCYCKASNVDRPVHSLVTILTELHRFQRMLRLCRKAQAHIFVPKHNYMFRSERSLADHHYKIFKIRANTVHCILPYFESSVMAV